MMTKICFCLILIKIICFFSFSDILDPLNFKEGDVWIYRWGETYYPHGGYDPWSVGGGEDYVLDKIIVSKDTVSYKLKKISYSFSNKHYSCLQKNQSADTSVFTIIMSRNDTIYNIAPNFSYNEDIYDSIWFEKVNYKSDTIIMKSLAKNYYTREYPQDTLVFLEKYGTIKKDYWAFGGAAFMMGSKRLVSFNGNEFNHDDIQIIGPVEIIIDDLVFDKKNNKMFLNNILAQEDLLSCYIYDLHGRCITSARSSYDFNKLSLSNGFYFLRLNFKNQKPLIIKFKNIK